MSVIIEKSVCNNCEGKTTCVKFRNLNKHSTIRDEMNGLYQGIDVGVESGAQLYQRFSRKKEVFELIIVNCSTKEHYDYKKKIKETKEPEVLYYCKLCKVMHKSNSHLGIKHKEFSGG